MTSHIVGENEGKFTPEFSGIPSAPRAEPGGDILELIMSQQFDNLLKEAADTYDSLRSSRFRRIEELGRGGMSIVYRAVDRKLDREVALKFLRSDLQPDPEAAARFKREARLSAGLDHPNVVKVFDAGEEGGRMYIVMECVEGRPLSKILGERNFEIPKMLRLLEKAARGVAAAHAKDIVHRDLKPANIIVMPDDEPKVGDFGLAIIMDLETTRLTQFGSSMGTPSYMAPEQVAGRSGSISPATDVYGLGAILYEILTGRPPHTGDTPLEILAKIGKEDPIRPRRINPKVHREVETICLKALEVNPARRYADAEEFADDLLNHFEGRPILAKAAGPTTYALKWMNRHMGITAAVAVLLLILGVWLTNETVHSAKLSSIASRARSARTAEERARIWAEAMKLDPKDETLRLHWERSRKRADAVRFTLQADRAEREFELIEARVTAREVDLLKLEKATNRWRKNKPGIWRLRAEIGILKTRAAKLRAAVVGGYTRAAGMDSGYGPPRRWLAEWYWDLFEEAELAGELDEMAEYLTYVKQYDNGKYGRLLDAPGSLMLKTDPPGARAVLYKYAVARDGRLVPSNPSVIGITPLELNPISQGSYLVEIKVDGRPPVRYPVRIRRGAVHEASVRIPTAEAIGIGFVHIPGGPFLAGEQDDLEPIAVGSFAIARHETTWKDFFEFLNDRYGPKAAELMRRKPGQVCPTWREENQRIVIDDGGEKPALGITWQEAVNYCVWRSDRDPKAAYRLPTPAEWEKAARGVDGRRFPWGNTFDWSFANAVRSLDGAPTPVAVGSFPKDKSVYGVRDMAGNAAEWCSGDFHAELGLKNVQGGSWTDEKGEDLELGERDGDENFLIDADNGFRVVRVQSR